jgi:hypothetical protein
MKNFVKGLLSNRFAIVLVTLNLCYFAHFASYGLAVSHYPMSNFDKIMLALHLPAAFLAALPSMLIEFLSLIESLSASSYRSPRFVQVIFPVFLFFVALQWLFIGWTARKIAQMATRFAARQT